MHRARLGLATIAAISVLTVNCAKKTATDQSLITDIQSKLYSDDTTRSAGIKVDAKNGVVTLSGDVPTSDVELEAMKVANATAGVARVDDQMKVNAAAAPGTPAPATPLAQTPPVPPPATTSTAATPPATTASAGSYPPVPAASTAPPAETPSPASAPAVAEEAPRRVRPAGMTVPAGSRLQVRMIDGIDSRNASVGQTFQATLDSPLVAGNRVVVQAGAPVTIVLDAAKSAGRIRGNSELGVRASNLQVGGRSYALTTDTYAEVGKGKGKQTAIRTGIGAAAGALIGGLAGGGKGAGIGAAAGGGAGVGYQALTHGSQVKIPSETVLTFRLQAPVTIR